MDNNPAHAHKETLPQPAASIILLRENLEQLELFMVARNQNINFAGGALVFPGGKVDSQDGNSSLINHLDGISPDGETRSLQVAAIRETFEESGILLAREEGTSGFIDGKRLESLHGYRNTLHNGEVSIHHFLRQEKLRLACDELTHYANWVTPAFMPRRFDTHFFLATAPAGQLAKHDGTESVDSLWLTPDKALGEIAGGRRTALFPTICILEKLGRYNTIDAALVDARMHRVLPVSPWIEQRGEHSYLCIAKDSGYETTEQQIVKSK